MTHADQGHSVQFAAPACPDAWFSHRLELDEPPANLAGQFRHWDGPPGVARRALCWETPWADKRVAVPPRFAPVTCVGMVREPGPLPAAIPASLVAEHQVDAFATAAAATQPAQGVSFARYWRWLARGLWQRGPMVTVRLSGRIVAGGALCLGPAGEARLREIFCVPDYRRRGYATAVVVALLEAAGDRVVVLSVPEDQPFLSQYQRLGFRPVSRFVEASVAAD